MADLGANGYLGSVNTNRTAITLTEWDPSTLWKCEQTFVVNFNYSPIIQQTTYAFPVTVLVGNQGSITGRVYYDGVPFANQAVLLHLAANHYEVQRARTDINGNFAFYGLDTTANTYYVAVPGSSSGIIRAGLTASTFVEIGLYSVTTRRPLVLINGTITEAPDGTTWAVGVPSTIGKYSATIGNGSSTSFTVTHSLGTQDVIVEVREAGSPYGAVDVQWEATSTSAITVTFATAPSSNQYRVNVIAL